MKNRTITLWPESMMSSLTVGQAAESLYGFDAVYDTALPQCWVDAMERRGFQAAGRYVWLYDPDGINSRPAPLTREALDDLARAATWI
jgi:hypothetical protein